MHFPKIKILIGYSVRFDNKNKQGDFLQFFSQDRKIETAESDGLQNIIKLGRNPSEYKMSTRREIKISITF
mgnify:CR=1 FL=1|jgi:hypothetical protein